MVSNSSAYIGLHVEASIAVDGSLWRLRSRPIRTRGRVGYEL